MKYWISCFFTLVFGLAVAQSSQDVVGKHRVQYKHLDWKFYSSPNFDIYYYNNNEALAKSAAQHAELEFDELTDLIGFSPYNKIQLYIYENKADLRQSNVGLADENNLLGGKTTFTKSIVEIPYPGNQIDFRYEIRYGIAKTLLYEMMYGGSFKESVQNTFLLTLPDWFLGGAALYAAYGWDQEMDDYMRDAQLYNNLRKPSNLIGDDAVLAGQSIWAYIVQRYGRSNFSNILNLTRVLRNEENSISSTLGIGYNRVIRDWRNYYKVMAEQTKQANQAIPSSQRLRRRNKANTEYNNIVLSKDGKLLAYSTNNLGKYSVYVRNLDTKHTRHIFTRGSKVLSQRVDYKTPLLSWAGNNTLFIVTTQKRSPELLIYNYENGHTQYRKIPTVTQVNAIDAFESAKEMVMSADRNGQTDLYVFYPSSYRLAQLTNDLADDLEPKFLPEGDEIVFSSNRKSDTNTAHFEHKDISENFNLYKAPTTLRPTEKNALIRLTNSPYSESKPVVLDEHRITYLSDESGIDNLHVLSLKDGTDTPYTDFAQDINNYDANATRGTLALTMRRDAKTIPFLLEGQTFTGRVQAIPTLRSQMLNPYVLQKQGISSRKSDSTAIAKARQYNDSLYTKRIDSLEKGRVNIRYYIFDSEKAAKSIVAPELKIAANVGNPAGLKSPMVIKDLSGNVKYPLKGLLGPMPYLNRLNFNSLNTNLLIDPLQSYGTQVEATMSDMFENHKFITSAIIFLDLRSSWYKAEYQYLKDRFDYKLRYNRRSYYYVPTSGSASERYLLSRFEGTVSYPLNIASDISFTPFYAQTKYIRIFENSLAGVATPEIVHPYVGYRFEYNFDNTIAHGMNIVEGTRIKVRYEKTVSTESALRNFGNFTADIRRYQSIHKELILALRGSYGKFSGPAAKKYMLGGMDNWAFNNTVGTAQVGDPFGTASVQSDDGITDRLFNQYVTNLRGFDYNSLYGSAYMIFNAELRFPIVRYLYKGPLESSFLKNFQLLAFYDMGTAWSGNNPFNGDNSVNTRTITSDQSFNITVTDFTDPFLRSYGMGIRTMALGYYTKLDLAQGFQNGVKQPLKLYLTLGYDF